MPYHHKGEDNAISYVVDLSKGKIAQQCHKCRPAHLNWKTFIQAGRLSFSIQDDEQSTRESADSVSVYKSEDPVQFFLEYFYSEVLYCKEKKQLMVYNKKLGVWHGGSDGNRLLLDLVDLLNDNYKTYMRAKNSKISSPSGLEPTPGQPTKMRQRQSTLSTRTAELQIQKSPTSGS